jgi:hypothetical protein
VTLPDGRHDLARLERRHAGGLVGVALGGREEAILDDEVEDDLRLARPRGDERQRGVVRRAVDEKKIGSSRRTRDGAGPRHVPACSPRLRAGGPGAIHAEWLSRS